MALQQMQYSQNNLEIEEKKLEDSLPVSNLSNQGSVVP
jgi:hypothetical protein